MARHPLRRLALLAVLAALAGARGAGARELVLAAATSLHDSGLLAELLPAFRARSGIAVRVVALPSAAAVDLARRGEADLVIAHDPDAEQRAIEEAALVARRPFAEDHLLVAGPAADPAGVKGAAGAVEAIARIAKAKAPFATRGDGSAVHQRERRLFEQAGLPPEPGWRGVVRTRAGMGATLEVAGEKGAYLLADAASFRAHRARVGLVVFSGPDPALRNVYSVLLVPPDRFPPGRIQSDAARAFFTWLVEPATLERIEGFRADGDGPLFRPLR
jgi:tungstate transport system substrate-binding protein